MRIKECHPMSKMKHFRVVEVIDRAEHCTDPVTGLTHYNKHS